MTQISQLSETNDDEIDIAKILANLWRGKWTIISLTLIFAVIGGLYAILATPIYNANALIQIEQKSGGLGSLSIADAFDGGGGGADTATELEIMRSRSVLEPTVDKYNLTIVAEPLKAPLIGGYFFRKFNSRESDQFGSPLLADWFDISNDYAWGGEKIIVNSFELPNRYIESKFYIINLGNDKFQLTMDGNVILEGMVGTQNAVKKYNLTLQVGLLKGRVGTYYRLEKLNKTKVIEALVESFQVSENGKKSGVVRISMDSEDPDKTVKIIDDILGTYQKQNIQNTNNVTGNSLKFIEERIPKTEKRLKDAEDKIYHYRLSNKTVDLTLQTQQLLDQYLKLEESLNALILKEPELARKYKKAHPIYTEFLRKKADIEQKLIEINAETGQIPTEQFNIYKLQRDVELSQKLHLQTLNKYEELKIVKAGTLGSIRVVDKTIAQPEPVKPKKAIILIVSILVGFIIAVAIILMKSLFNANIMDKEQLNALGYNVLALVPNSDAQLKLNKLRSKTAELLILSDSHPDDTSVEALRSLRTSVCFTMLEAKNNMIMIAGPSSDIGKSFTSVNLATLLAQAEKKVLLVDLDLRRGGIEKYFGLNQAPGISEYLTTKEEFATICQNSKIDGLDVITCGGKPKNPSELLMGNKFTEFCKLIEPKYDFIIFDTPPILAVTDAATIGRMVGTSIMVVKHNKSHLKEINLSHDKLATVGVKVDGYVLNGVDKPSSSQSYEYV